MTLGDYPSKDRMFEAMKLRGIGSRFWALTSTGSAFLYEVRPRGLHPVSTYIRKSGQKATETPPWSTPFE